MLDEELARRRATHLCNDGNRDLWRAYISAERDIRASRAEDDRSNRGGAIDHDPILRPGFAVGVHQRVPVLPSNAERAREAAYNLVSHTIEAAQDNSVRLGAKTHINELIKDAEPAEKARLERLLLEVSARSSIPRI